MFVGHGLLAFAVAATLARRRGVAAERALTVGVVAGAFATAPDIDVAYALWGLLGAVGGIGAPSTPPTPSGRARGSSTGA